MSSTLTNQATHCSKCMNGLFCCCVGLGKLSQAEEYLAQAEWTALKTPGCGDDIKSRLYRNLGLLNAAKGDYPEALTYFADDVS